MFPDLPSTNQGQEKSNQEESEKVYADLVEIYPENESYLRCYAELLLKSGKKSTATIVLTKLYALLEKNTPDKASALAQEFPQIGRITKNESEQSSDSEFGEMLRKALGILWIKLHQKRLKEGNRLYSRDEQGDTLALVLKGEIAVCIPGKNQPSILLNLIGENDVVGEACFLNPGTRNADVIANKESIVVEIPRNKLIGYLIENPGLGKVLEKKTDFRQMTNLLSSNDLFQDVPLDMRKYIAKTTRTERYQPHTFIRQAGQEMDAVDMLIWGKANYMIRNKNNEHQTLGEFKASELIGDVSALRKATCPADIVAISEVLIAHIPLSSFTNIVEAYPPLKEKLLQHAQTQRTKIMHMISQLKIPKEESQTSD